MWKVGCYHILREYIRRDPSSQTRQRKISLREFERKKSNQTQNTWQMPQISEVWETDVKMGEAKETEQVAFEEVGVNAFEIIRFEGNKSVLTKSTSRD